MPTIEEGGKPHAPGQGDSTIPVTNARPGGFPRGLGQRLMGLKNGMLSFAAWMGGAEFTCMWLAAESHGSTLTSGEVGVVLWKASLVGALIGVIPAVVVAVVIQKQMKNPFPWAFVLPLALASVPITLVSLAILRGILFRFI